MTNGWSMGMVPLTAPAGTPILMEKAAFAARLACRYLARTPDFPVCNWVMHRLNPSGRSNTGIAVLYRKGLHAIPLNCQSA